MAAAAWAAHGARRAGGHGSHGFLGVLGICSYYCSSTWAAAGQRPVSGDGKVGSAQFGYNTPLPSLLLSLCLPARSPSHKERAAAGQPESGASSLRRGWRQARPFGIHWIEVWQPEKSSTLTHRRRRRRSRSPGGGFAVPSSAGDPWRGCGAGDRGRRRRRRQLLGLCLKGNHNNSGDYTIKHLDQRQVELHFLRTA